MNGQNVVQTGERSHSETSLSMSRSLTRSEVRTLLWSTAAHLFQWLSQVFQLHWHCYNNVLAGELNSPQALIKSNNKKNPALFSVQRREKD